MTVGHRANVADSVAPDDALVARELGRGQARCYASPSYLERRKKPRRPADLEGHDCILYAPLAPGGRWSFRVNHRHTSVRGRLVVNSLPLSLDAALRGGGIVRLPAPFAAEGVKSGALVELRRASVRSSTWR